jgi:hypothetical protein
MSEREQLKRAKDKINLKGVRAELEKDKVPRSDREELAFLRGKAEAYWDAEMIIEQEFGSLL